MEGAAAGIAAASEKPPPATQPSAHAGLQQVVWLLCIGGHLRVPKEQKTQQSPGLGVSSVLQDSHS